MTTATTNGAHRVRISPPPSEVRVEPAAAALEAPGWRITAPQPVTAVVSEPEPIVAAAGADNLPKEPDYRDEVTAEAVPDRTGELPTELATQSIYAIVREVALPHSGDDLYSAVADDGGAALGLCYGVVLFPQASPHLGSVLRLMWLRDPQAFQATFGPHASDLIAAVGAGDPAGRLAQVGGEPLWGPGWKERFRAAGEHAGFQAAQNEEAIEHQVRPLLPVAATLGLATERLVAMLYEAAVSRGLGGGVRWAVEACSPLRDAAVRERILRGLGYADLAAFQAGVEGLVPDGAAGPATHLALIAAARERELLPMPDAGEPAGRMLAAAHGRARERLLTLADSPRLSDAPVSEA